MPKRKADEGPEGHAAAQQHGHKTHAGPAASLSHTARIPPGKLIDETKKRTETAVHAFCKGLVPIYLKRWDDRLEEIKANRPRKVVVVPNPLPDPAELDKQTSEEQTLEHYDDTQLLTFLERAEKDALEMIDVLKEIELWVTLHAPPLDLPSFGAQLQNEMLSFLSNFIQMVGNNMYSLGSQYIRQKCTLQSSIQRFKYKPSDNPCFEASALTTWQNLEYSYTALKHRSILLYQRLTTREELLRKPVSKNKVL